MVIESGGDVGIGVTNPSSKLHVGGTVKFEDSLYLASRGLISWGTMGGGTGFGIRGESGNGLSLGSNGVWDRMIINTSGNVGIGTASPTDTLDVDGGIRLSTSGRIQGRSYPYTTNIGSGANATTTNITAGSNTI